MPNGNTAEEAIFHITVANIEENYADGNERFRKKPLSGISKMY